MKLYKLTDKNDRAYNGTCQWGEGIEFTADGKGELCTEHWIHAYTHPLLAVFLNPIHADYNLETAHLWECEGEVGKEHHGLKVGCTSLTTLRKIELPKVTTEQKVKFAILCALEVCQDKEWRKWAKNWLSGKDRTAWAAERVVRTAGWTAIGATAKAAMWTAWAPIWATEQAPIGVARAAEWAAEEKQLDLITLAKKAVEEQSKDLREQKKNKGGLNDSRY